MAGQGSQGDGRTATPPRRRRPRPGVVAFWVSTDLAAAGRPRAGGDRPEPVTISGCDYLGLSLDPAIREVWVRASASGPLQTGASRVTTGDHPRYRRAEAAIAAFLGEPAAAFLATGYLASLAVAQALAGETTHVVLDDAAHTCVRDGAALTGLPVLPFRSGDPEALRRVLGRLPRSARPLVATDGVRGLRGGILPIDAYLAALPGPGWLWVDDAHGIGTVGRGGRGAVEALGLGPDPRLVRSLTGSKALGVAGGAVVGQAAVVDRIRAHAGAYRASSAPPLAVAAAFTAAVGRLRRTPGRVRRLQALGARFSAALPDRPGVLTDPRTPVTAIHPVDAAQAQRIDSALQAAGFVPPWIRYPGGPAEGFFRIALRATLATGQVDRLARAIRDAL